MKKCLSLVLLFLSFAVARPAAAQFAVHDPLAYVEHLAQTLKQIDQYRNMKRRLDILRENLEKMDRRTWRDMAQFMDGVNELAAHGEALAYSRDGALDLLLTYFPANLVLTAEAVQAGEDIGAIHQYWSGVLRDTYAGALGAASQQGGDHERLNQVLRELQGSSDSAHGLSRNLHVGNMIDTLQAQELMKLNQLLASLVNLESVRSAYDNTVRSGTAETLDAMAFPLGWDGASILYEDYQEIDPVP